MSRPYFERVELSRKANRKSQKLFPFVKMIENHRGVLIHLKTLTSVSLEQPPGRDLLTMEVITILTKFSSPTVRSFGSKKYSKKMKIADSV